MVCAWHQWMVSIPLIARFMGPTWGPSGADRTQVGSMLAPWTLLTGLYIRKFLPGRPCWACEGLLLSEVPNGDHGSTLVQVMATCSAPWHNLHQCWFIVNWTLRNKLQLNFKIWSFSFIKMSAKCQKICSSSNVLNLHYLIAPWEILMQF